MMMMNYDDEHECIKHDHEKEQNSNSTYTNDYNIINYGARKYLNM